MSDVVVCGIGGRMGQRLAHLSLDSGDLSLVGATERSGHEAVGQDIGTVIGRSPLGVKVADDPLEAVGPGRVLIDFTAPESTLKNAAACAAKGTAMVVGTTGLSDEELAEFRRLVEPVPCVMAPNFSTAMNVLFKLVEEAARILGDDYDVEIIEAHHRHKVDAPSGSALGLAERAAAGLERNLAEVAVYGREGAVGQRTTKEIGIHAVRGGDLAGDHRVLFASDGEYIELGHHATSRDAFALGALRAVRFAAGAKPGFYDMRDVLQLK